MKIRQISLAGATVALLAMTPAWADKTPPPPLWSVTYPDGLACDGFDLLIQGWGGNRQFKTFKDKNGNVVRSLDAGTGTALLFTNGTTGKTFSTESNGAVHHIKYNPGGSYTETDTGHDVIILFPTDNPPGPTTTLIAGRVVFTVDTSGNFNVQSMHGNITDICAVL